VGGCFLGMNYLLEWSGSQGVSAGGVLFCAAHPDVGKTHSRLVTKVFHAGGYY